jgi:hypothetical protein
VARLPCSVNAAAAAPASRRLPAGGGLRSDGVVELERCEQPEPLRHHRRALPAVGRDQPDRAFNDRFHQWMARIPAGSGLVASQACAVMPGMPVRACAISVEIEFVSTTGTGLAPASWNAPSTIRRCCMSGVNRHSAIVAACAELIVTAPANVAAGTTSRWRSRHNGSDATSAIGSLSR